MLIRTTHPRRHAFTFTLLHEATPYTSGLYSTLHVRHTKAKKARMFGNARLK